MAGLWLADPNGSGDPDDLSGLAESWDKCEEYRHVCIKNKALLQWPNAKLSGRINNESLHLNVKVMDLVCGVFLPQACISKDFAN